jgi:hypothetical protein
MRPNNYTKIYFDLSLRYAAENIGDHIAIHMTECSDAPGFEQHGFIGLGPGDHFFKFFFEERFIKADAFENVLAEL